MRGLARAVATVGGVGLSPVAPGTAGALAALPLGWLLHWAGSFPLLLAATLAAAAFGFWAASPERRGDLDREIVIDEVAGMWLALWPLSAGLWWMEAPAHLFPWPGWVGAFVVFRALDIWKPGPVGWAERRAGAAGTVLGDLVAGALAALAVAAAAVLAHGVLM